MTVGDQVTYAKRRARVSSNVLTLSTTDDVVYHYINDGVQEFARRIGGIPREEYLTLSPRFDLRTNFAINITITGGANAIAATDLPLCTSSYNDYGGATLASVIEAQISNVLAVSCTMSWDAASWIWSLRDNTAACTYIEVNAPVQKTYVDATGLIFNRTGTANATYFEGNFPLDCTVETDLPTGFMQIEHVFWDGDELPPAPFDLFVSPQAQGNPQWYAIKNGKIRIAPCPTQQKEFKIRYKYVPTDTTAGDSTVTCPLPLNYHMIPVYWATAMLLQEQHEFDKANQHMGLFGKAVLDYAIRENNQNPTLFPGRPPEGAPEVVVPSA